MAGCRSGQSSPPVPPSLTPFFNFCRELEGYQDSGEMWIKNPDTGTFEKSFSFRTSYSEEKGFQFVIDDAMGQGEVRSELVVKPKSPEFPWGKDQAELSFYGESGSLIRQRKMNLSDAFHVLGGRTHGLSVTVPKLLLSQGKSSYYEFSDVSTKSDRQGRLIRMKVEPIRAVISFDEDASTITSISYSTEDRELRNYHFEASLKTSVK